MPKLNCKKGKDIQKEIDSLPIVDIDELNNIVNYDSGGWKNTHIGFNGTNEKYFGFIILDKWDIKMPIDCTEITASEYKKLFKKRKE